MNTPLSIIASHNWRMLCILRSFLLDYNELRLTPIEGSIDAFFTQLVEDAKKKTINAKGIISELKKCTESQFVDTWNGTRHSSSNTLKCFPQFVNGAGLHISVRGDVLTVDLLPPTSNLDGDEDLEKKMVFVNKDNLDKYPHFYNTVKFSPLKYTINQDCVLIKHPQKISNFDIVIVRHGQGYHNKKGVGAVLSQLASTLGTSDTHLTPKGVKDAEAAADSMRGLYEQSGDDEDKDNTYFFSSDLYRAKETAVQIAKKLNEKRKQVTITQFPIIHEISNCEKADSINKSSKPDMNFPGDLKNQNDNVYCENWGKRNASRYKRNACGDEGIEVKIDYKEYYKNVPFYNRFFKHLYGSWGTGRTWRGATDPTFFFKPYEIVELLIAFTCREMYKKKGLIVNVHGESNGGVKQDEIKTGFSIEDAEKLGIPGFRSEDQIEKFKNFKALFRKMTGGRRRASKYRKKRTKRTKRRTTRKTKHKKRRRTKML